MSVYHEHISRKNSQNLNHTVNVELSSHQVVNINEIGVLIFYWEIEIPVTKLIFEISIVVNSVNVVVLSDYLLKLVVIKIYSTQLK